MRDRSGLESFFPLFSEVAQNRRELDSIGFVKYRHELADAARDPDTTALDKVTLWYRAIVADGFDFASYVRSSPSNATFMNDRSQGRL